MPKSTVRPAPSSTAANADPQALPLPHEREAEGGYAGEKTRPVIRQAKKDLDGGLVDTDLHGAAGQDDAQRRRLLQNERQPARSPKRD